MSVTPAGLLSERLDAQYREIYRDPKRQVEANRLQDLIQEVKELEALDNETLKDLEDLAKSDDRDPDKVTLYAHFELVLDARDVAVTAVESIFESLPTQRKTAARAEAAKDAAAAAAKVAAKAPKAVGATKGKAAAAALPEPKTVDLTVEQKTQAVRNYLEDVDLFEADLSLLVDVMPVDARPAASAGLSLKLETVTDYLRSLVTLEDSVLDICADLPDGVLPADVEDATGALQAVAAYLQRSQAKAKPKDTPEEHLREHMILSFVGAKVDPGPTADAEIARLTQERDAAVQELESFKKHRTRAQESMRRNGEIIKKQLSALVDMVGGDMTHVNDLPVSLEADALSARQARKAAQ